MGSDTEENRGTGAVPGTATELDSELGGDGLLSMSSQRHGSRAVVEISGELDLSGTELLKSKLREVLAEGVDTLEIDASRLGFIDSVGLTMLLAFRLNTVKEGVAFRVVAASEQYARVVRLAGLADDLLPPDPAADPAPGPGSAPGSGSG